MTEFEGRGDEVHVLPLSFSEYFCFKQGDKSEAYDDYFLKKIIDNPVYMGKIAYGRRRTEKKTGTRNEMHVVEQSEFPVYEGIHEAIISEEDWNLAQEKRSKNNYRREKIHDPKHAHILSGILKCPCCGKGMYGNIAKVAICIKRKSPSGRDN